jgi:hypothetical protein
MFIAMNRFRVTKGPKQPSRKSGCRATLISIRCPASSNSTCLKAPKPKTHALCVPHGVAKPLRLRSVDQI